MKKGFTLIEVLMVILILAILVAIAVPQYELVIDQSRLSTLFSNTRALKEAQERIWMQTAHYADKATSLDIDIPGEYDEGQIISQNATYTLSIDNTGSKIIATHPKVPDVFLEQYLSESQNFPRELHCKALTANPRACRLCEQSSIGVLGTVDDYTVYLFEGAGNGSLEP